MRAGHRRPDRPADGRPRADPAGGHAGRRAGPRRPGPQGRVPEAPLRPAPAGLRARPRERDRAGSRRGDRARQEQEAHDRGGRRPPGHPGYGRGAPRRLPRDGPPARGGRGRRRGAGRRPGLGVLGAPGLRPMRHLVPRGLAADVLLQQSVRRVPRVRGARDPARARPRPRRAGPAEVAGQGGARALGRARVGLLPADPRGARAEAALQPGDPLEGALEGDPGADPPGHRRGRGLRRRARRPRAPVQGDDLRGHPGRDRALHGGAPVPGLRRGPPPARESGGPRGRAPDPPGVRAHDQGRRRLLRRARARRARAGDRPARPQGDPRAARLPPERGARVPHPRPGGRHALGRRGTADPPGDADRIEPGRRPLHPRRAVDRSPPAGQPPPPRHASPAAGPRQHGPGRRARRGDDPGRRPRDRPRSRGRGAGRLRRRRPARPGRSWRTRSR